MFGEAEGHERCQNLQELSAWLRRSLVSRRPFEKADSRTFSWFNGVIGVLVVLTAYCCIEEVQCCDNEVFNLI